MSAPIRLAPFFAATAVLMVAPAIAQTAAQTDPVILAPTPAPTCRLDVIGATPQKGVLFERDAAGAMWLSYHDVPDPMALRPLEAAFYRTDTPLVFYVDGKKIKPPKGSAWQYGGTKNNLRFRIKFAPDAKWQRALANAGTLSVRIGKIEVASIPLIGLAAAMPDGASCPAQSGTAKLMAEVEQSFGPNRAQPILRDQMATQCEFTATDQPASKALRIGGTAREFDNVSLQLVGPLTGPLDDRGRYWLPNDGGMQILVDGKAVAIPDSAIKGVAQGANFGQVIVTLSDSNPAYAALLKAKTVTVRTGKTEVFRFSLAKMQPVATQSQACFQGQRNRIAAANSTPNSKAQPATNPGVWVPKSAYPRRALRDKREGRAGFILSVDKYGFPYSCTIKSSSGHADLDEATCTNLMRRAKFHPATDADGKVQRSTYTSAVNWRLEG